MIISHILYLYKQGSYSDSFRKQKCGAAAVGFTPHPYIKSSLSGVFECARLIPLYDFTFPRHLIMCGYIILEDFKMDKYVLDNNNGLPCLTLSPEEEKPIGIWGQRHKRYLQEHRKATYTTLLTSGMLMLILPTSTNRAGTL